MGAPPAPTSQSPDNRSTPVPEAAPPAPVYGEPLALAEANAPATAPESAPPAPVLGVPLALAESTDAERPPEAVPPAPVYGEPLALSETNGPATASEAIPSAPVHGEPLALAEANAPRPAPDPAPVYGESLALSETADAAAAPEVAPIYGERLTTVGNFGSTPDRTGPTAPFRGEGPDDPLRLAQGATEPASTEELFGLPTESAPELEPLPATSGGASPVATEEPGGLPVEQAPVTEPAAPATTEELFGLPAEKAPAAPATVEEVPARPAEQAPAAPATTEELFGLPAEEAPTAPATPSAPAPAAETASTLAGRPGTTVFGFFQSELGYVYAGPDHWQKFRNTLELGARGRFAGGTRWVMSGRLFVDPVFAFEEFYPDGVREDRGYDGMIRETYLDTTVGEWELRLGRQNVIWGEMVALFFADVVSARDLREFVLQDFDWLRIPQWAARAEYFEGDFHAELLWIPYFTYDEIGDPADDYFPFKPPVVPGLTNAVQDDERPGDELDHGGYGVRANYLVSGWDMSAFYYTAPSLSPAFARSLNGTTLVYRPTRNREHQVGATLAKDFGVAVMKGEMVYTADRLFETATPTDVDGVSSEDFVSYIVSAEFSWAHDTRFTLQAFQQRFFDREPGVPLGDVESGLTVLFSTGLLHPDIIPEVIYVTSLDQQDSMLQARVSWAFLTNWRAILGADVFTGDQYGLFGRFDQTDRVYSELRYTF